MGLFLEERYYIIYTWLNSFRVIGRVLQRDEERFGAAKSVLTELVAILEPDLVGELADERTVLATGTPDRQCRRRQRHAAFRCFHGSVVLHHSLRIR